MIHLHLQRYEYMEEANEGILKQIPPSNSSQESWVLDVGCGGGLLGSVIRARGYRVWGVEKHAESAQRAAGRLDRVTETDLTCCEHVKNAIGSQKFQYLVFSDVLEHLYDPLVILREYLPLLAEDGKVLISVPNIAAWTIRLKLLLGIFRYHDTGIMDRTHIRFFTFSTAMELVKASGCSIEKIDYTPYFVRAFLPLIKAMMFKDAHTKKSNPGGIINSPLYRIYLKRIYPLEYWAGFLFKGLFAFRIIIVGRKSPAFEL